jgi:hypothetical protein
MRDQGIRRAWLVGAAMLLLVSAGIWAFAQDEPPAQAGEKVGVMANFVRVAENQEGWVVVGYGAANESVGKDWMMLNVGMTLQQGVKDQELTRDKVMLVTPDGKEIRLASQDEVEKGRGTLDAMSRADAMIHESINYFPAGVTRPCRIGFFTDPSQMQRAPAYDQVELNNEAACVGRLYFQLPEPLQVGTYNLDVQFEGSVIRVPIEIMTKEQAKEFEKEWKESTKKK